MLGRLHLFRVVAVGAGVAALALTLAVPARAEGTVRVQQTSGAVQNYDNVKIQILHQTLNVTTADGKGTLIIYRAACSYQGEIMACLPTGVTLVQGGDVSAIKIVSGTVYVNMTDDAQALPLSTMHVPAHGVVMALQTHVGTYITMNGTIDKVTK